MVYRSVLRALFPELCPRCAGPTDAGYCAGCRADFPRIRDACRRCGLCMPVAVCPRARIPWQVEAVSAPFDYEASLQQQLLALKFRGTRLLGRALGVLLADFVAAERKDVDALIPVPLHPSRLRERGYNQAAEIARCVASRLDIPLLLRGLRRVRAGAPQAGLNAAARRENLLGAFRAQYRFAGLRVAVVDDVITTGVTINACAKVLREAGAVAVRAWAIARTAESSVGARRDALQRDQPAKV